MYFCYVRMTSVIAEQCKYVYDKFVFFSFTKGQLSAGPILVLMHLGQLIMQDVKLADQRKDQYRWKIQDAPICQGIEIG